MQIVESTATFTRPSDTTAYASGDLIANSTTNTLVTPMSFIIPYGKGFKLWKASVKHSTTTVTNAKWRLHLYLSSPTVANGDNGAWSGIEASYQGYIDIDGSVQAFTDAGKAWGIYVNNALEAPLYIAGNTNRTVYGLLTATAAYGPGSAEVFTVSLVGEAYV